VTHETHLSRWAWTIYVSWLTFMQPLHSGGRRRIWSGRHTAEETVSESKTWHLEGVRAAGEAIVDAAPSREEHQFRSKTAGTMARTE
jgi:hypothetical protein